MESSLATGSERVAASSILIVDDELASGELVAALLQSQGYLVRLVDDGRRALEIIAEGGVDLLVCDLMMPKLDGVEVCAHVRNELHDPQLPIVITTSLNDRESRIRAKEAGADDVIVKPLDGLELLVRIESLLRARAHTSALTRERLRVERELASTRSALARASEAASTMRSLLDAQERTLESARQRSAQVAQARETFQRLAEITDALRECVSALAAPTSTVNGAEHRELSSGQLEESGLVARATK